MASQAPQPGVFFSVDRVASRNDTMFGVAMTLVATTLLSAVQVHRSLLDPWRDVGEEISSVVLSFAISARYWAIQQQRLAWTPALDSRQSSLHLVFLFLRMLIPISTGLPGLPGASAIRGSVVVYGAHLSLIA